jgi:hypothetical protein
MSLSLPLWLLEPEQELIAPFALFSKNTDQFLMFLIPPEGSTRKNVDVTRNDPGFLNWNGL